MWRLSMMEEMDGARMIECLRGRLLAERTATKLARHEAQLMETKLIELENQLCEETKIKDKAEKKLTLLLNKLHSLEINYVVNEDLENCCSRVFFITSKDAKELRPKESGHARCRSDNSVDEAIRVQKGGTSDCSEDAFSTVTTNSESNAQIDSVEKFPDMKSEGIFDGDYHFSQTISELKSVNEEHNADNSLAIVSVLETPSSSEKIEEDLNMRDCIQTVGDALNAVRQARREIERSMERRRMVKARWTQLILS